MLVRVLRREKIGGMRLVPETIVELSDSLAKECIRRGIAESMDVKMHTNLLGTEGTDILIRNEE